MESCDKHWDETAVAACRDCHRGACSACLIRIGRLGELCIDCALVRGGVAPVTSLVTELFG